MSSSDETADRIDEALSEHLGLHGGWVLSVEVYDEDGEPTLHVIRQCPNIWAAMGLIEATRETTLQRFRDPE